jgi:hypothetical protein
MRAGGGRRIAVDLFLMVAIGVVLGIIGPFGSAAMPPAWRLLAWVGFIVAGYAVFRPVKAVAGWVAEETRLPRPLTVAMTVLVASLPLACLVAFALGNFSLMPFWTSDIFLLLYAQVAAVGLGIQLLMAFLRPAVRPEPFAGEQAAEERAVAAPAEAYSFLRRLPPRIGQDLLCLEMQDHYVRARTGAGSELILMRMSDAVDELGILGLQVHRSWWVALDAIAQLERNGRNARLALTDGTAVPVSRFYLPAVEAALGARFDSGGRRAKSRPEPAGNLQ